MLKNSLIKEALGCTNERCMSLHSDLHPKSAKHNKHDGDDDLYSSIGITKSFGASLGGAGLVAIHKELVGVETCVCRIAFGSYSGTIFIWLIYVHK